MMQTLFTEERVRHLRKSGKVGATCKLLGGILFASLLAFSGCAKPASSTVSSSPATKTTTAAPTTATAAGPQGDLRIMISSFGAETFDPVTVVTGGTIAATMVQVFDWLLTTNGPEIRPQVIEKWELAPDNLSWTLHVRKGIKFHNGDELTAKDVKFTLDRYMSKESFYNYIRDALERAEIVDDYAVRVYTKGTQPTFLRLLGAEASASQGLVLPKDYFDRVGKDYFNQHPVGSGSFKFARRVPGDMVEYDAIDKHWLQTPSFKKLSIILVPEENTRVAALKTGYADAIEVGLEAALELSAGGFRTPRLSRMNASIRTYGTYDPSAAGMPLADVRVRQALSLAINRDDIIKGVFNGKAEPAFAATLTDSIADVDLPYWKEYGAKANRYDVQEAKRLLSEAGYPQGFSMKLYSYSMGGAPYLPKLMEVVQGYWQKIGVNAQLSPTDWGTFSPMRWVGSGAGRVPNPLVVGQASPMASSERADITSLLLTAVIRSTGSYAMFGKSKPELDTLVDTAAKTMDPAVKKEAVAKLLKAYVDSYANPPLAVVPQLSALGPRVDATFPRMADQISAYANIMKHRQQ